MINDLWWAIINNAPPFVLQVQFERTEMGSDFWWAVFHRCPWLWSLMLVNLASVLWGVCLLRFQLVIISRGVTSYFQAAVTRSQLTIVQRVRNVIHFLIGKKLYAVETPEGVQLL